MRVPTYSAAAVAVLLCVGLALLASAVRLRQRGARAARAARTARAQQRSRETFYDPSAANGAKRTRFPTVFAAPSVTLSVVVPAYNEEDRLHLMLDEALSYLEARRVRSAAAPFTYEIVVVDDGSRDGTVRVARTYTDRYGAERVRVLESRQNGGKGAAVKKGMLVARGHRLLMADADGATRFRDVELLERRLDEIAPARRGRAGGGSASHAATGVVIGCRRRRTEASPHSKKPDDAPSAGDDAGASSTATRTWLRNLLGTGFNLVVTWLGGVHSLSDTQCGFKLYGRESARTIFLTQHLTRWAFDVELLYVAQRMRYPVAEVPVHWTEIPGSKVNLRKAIVNMTSDLAAMRLRYALGVWRVATP